MANPEASPFLGEQQEDEFPDTIVLIPISRAPGFHGAIRLSGIWAATFALRSLRAVRLHNLEGERRPAFAAENPRDLRPTKRERRARCRIRIKSRIAPERIMI